MAMTPRINARSKAQLTEMQKYRIVLGERHV